MFSVDEPARARLAFNDRTWNLKTTMSTSDGPNTTSDPESDAALLDLLAAELNADEPARDVNDARIAELERRLEERNQLVELLTERLEQAADQIDRLQRSGGVLKSDAPAGLPLEFLNEHHELAQRLETFHNAWEERYEGPSLRRIEASLAELTERLDELRTSEPSSSQPVTSFLDQHAAEAEDDAARNEEDGGAGSVVSGMPAASAAGESTASQIEIVLLTPEDDPLPGDVPLPTAVDLTEATAGDLRDAVRQRDLYLSWLCQRVRQLSNGLNAWMKRFETEHAGTPSGEQFRELRQLIHSQIQVLEVELSIERAKLSREESRLEQEQERLARERELFEKQRGQAGSTENETALMKRWKRFIQPDQ